MAGGTTQTVTIYINSNTTAAVQGFQNFNTTVRQTVGEVEEVGKSAKKTGQAFVGMSSHLMNLLSMFSVWRSYSIAKEQLTDLIKVSAEFEKLDFAMQRMVGTQAALANMPWIEQLGRATYGISNVEKAFMQLGAVGLKPTKEQMEGLTGYLLTIGRTGEHELGRVVDKLVQLGNLGNVGMDEGLRQIAKEIPFVIDALAAKLKVDPITLFLRDFKSKSVDFKTIVKAIYEYAEKYYRQGITDTAYLWDVMLLRLKSNVEAFRKEIGQAGFFQEIRKWLGGIMDEIDRLQTNGTLIKWANQISDALTDMFKKIGLGSFSVEQSGEKLVRFMNSLSDATPGIKGAASAVGGLASALNTIFTLFGQLPEWITGPAGWGILGKFLFGGQGAVILGGIGVLKELLDRIEKGAKEGKSGAIAASNDIGGNESAMPAETSMGNAWKGIRNLFVKTTNSAELVYLDHDGNLQVASSAAEAAEKNRQYGEWVGNQAVAHAEYAGEAYKKRLNEFLRASSTGAVENPASKGTGMTEGIMPLMNQIKAASNKLQTHLDAIGSAAAMAGKEGLERDLAHIQTMADKANEDLKIFKAASKEAASLEWAAEKYDSASKIINDYTKVEEKLVADLNALRSGKTEEWNKRDQEKWLRNLVDIRDIDQNVAVVMKAYGSYYTKAVELATDAQAQGLRGYSDAYEGQVLDVQRKLEKTNAEIDKWVPAEEARMQEIFEKLTKHGKNATPEALALYGWLREYMAQLPELSRAAKQSAAEGARAEQDIITTLGKAENEKKMQERYVQLMQLIGTTKELIGAERALDDIVTGTDWLKAGNLPKEQQLIAQIKAMKDWVSTMRASGNAIDGFRYGMWDLDRQMPTAFDTGIEAAKRLKQAFDDLGTGIAELVTEGTFDFNSFARSIIKDLMAMYIQMTITKPLFSWFT
ncbi:MAG: hypothetical protein LLG06_04600, partial [Desulfobacteraceae bacterium]|nr:hypothetical protein [Desulfobacteraceae bacterium]